jgi:hypothetical protein
MLQGGLARAVPARRPARPRRRWLFHDAAAPRRTVSGPFAAALRPVADAGADLCRGVALVKVRADVLKLLDGDGGQGESGAKADDNRRSRRGRSRWHCSPACSPAARRTPLRTSRQSRSASWPSAKTVRRGRRTEWSKLPHLRHDATLLGRVAGPLLNVLPRRRNAANQQRLQPAGPQQAVTDALAQVISGSATEQPLAAQQKADQAAQLATLQQQLQAGGEAARWLP